MLSFMVHAFCELRNFYLVQGSKIFPKFSSRRFRIVDHALVLINFCISFKVRVHTSI